MSTVDISFHLVVGQRFDANGNWPAGKPTVRTTKSRPALEAHEVSLEINLSLPRGLFVRPALRANLTVPEGSAPINITPDLASNIADVVRDQLGIVLHVQAPAQEAQS